MNKERLVFEVTDRVMTPEGCKELVSRAARLMALSPDYLIRCAFDFESVDAFHLAVGSWVCNR